ncbi:MAG: phage baseplate assembly protein V [Patescibacteria group bacterium]|jgi:hypothetical protein
MFDLDQVKALEDTQKSNFYRAKVVSLDDPLKLNRIQVMIYGLTDDFEEPENVEDSPQPWCEFQFRDGVVTYPNIDDIIWLWFEGGDIFRPVYLGTIYAGLDISTEAGFEKLLEQRGTKVEDLENYKTALKTLNQTGDQDKLIAKDAHQAFSNFMLTEDDIPFQIFDGDDADGEIIYHDERDISDKNSDLGENVEPFQAYGINWGHYKYWPKIPKGWAGRPMYVWYTTEDITEEEAAAGTTWKDKCGGWTFYTAEQVQEGMASFPDNLRHFNYKRFQKWKKGVEGVRFDITKEKGNIPGWEQEYSSVQQQWMWRSNTPDNTIFQTPGAGAPFFRSRPHRWEFIADYPFHFWQPEKTCDNGLWHSWIQSFPFGKMNLKNRKYWKQHTFLSHDAKSSIELDDNDNYERLALIFDHGSGGLEFSHAGMNGIDMWTDGVFHFHAGGRSNAGGPKEHSMFFPGGDFAVQARKASLVGDNEATVYATGSAKLIGKLGSVTIMGNAGISLTSWGGLTVLKGGDGSVAPDRAQPVDTRGVWFGTPLISSPMGYKSGLGSSGFQALFLCLPTVGGEEGGGGSMSDESAQQWVDKFNMAMICLKTLFKVLGKTNNSMALPVMAGWATTIEKLLDDWEIESSPCSGAKFGSAWKGIAIQGARS